MSEIFEICKNTADQANELLIEMLEGNWPDNKLLSGSVQDGNTAIQVQLLITKNSADFLDEQ
jgi:hypothetical protein